jgi:hypothetical protein
MDPIFDIDADELFNYNVLLFENDQPDVQVKEIVYETELSYLMETEIGYGAIQTIVSNHDQDTKDKCPYFRVVATPPGESIPKNFKFETFLKKIGQGLIMNARCLKVLVIGLHALNNLDSPISIPTAFCHTNIDDFCINTLGSVDMSCLKPVGAYADSGFNLMQIAGISMPYYLPQEVQSRIFSDCESPEAMIIKSAIQDICDNWEIAMMPMFLQREPRIPCHIAYAYNVAYVAKTINRATRPFLAPLA